MIEIVKMKKKKKNKKHIEFRAFPATIIVDLMARCMLSVRVFKTRFDEKKSRDVKKLVETWNKMDFFFFLYAYAIHITFWLRHDVFKAHSQAYTLSLISAYLSFSPYRYALECSCIDAIMHMLCIGSNASGRFSRSYNFAKENYHGAWSLDYE